MNDPSRFWMTALMAVILYCIAQGIRDLKAKQYGWAIAAAFAAIALASMPIQSHMVKIDLPVAD